MTYKTSRHIRLGSRDNNIATEGYIVLWFSHREYSLLRQCLLGDEIDEREGEDEVALTKLPKPNT